jgi:4-carboxymuconolactone decarboxylase
MTTELLEAGRAMRREVLGADYVDNKAATSWAFAQPYADLVSEFCWGAIWTRPGLARRDRSLLNLGMLAALGREAELELHTGAALTNGVTPEEIREAFLQIGVYCGVPAGLEGMRILKRVLDERGIVVDE